MTTRRERLERKADKRDRWADNAGVRAADKLRRAHDLAGQIPPGQPILIGHHSEKRHRRHLARIDANMARGVEERRKAEHHASKAAGLREQLDRNIYSDDPDAVEALEARILELEAQRELRKATNARWRAHGKPGPEDQAGWDSLVAVLRQQPPHCALAGPDLDRLVADARRTMVLCSWHKAPFPPYSLTNLGANIRRLRQRIDQVKRRQARTEEAVRSKRPAVQGQTWVSVTFPEKPDREILQALKASGFRWKDGSWWGERARLPEGVQR